MVMANFDTLATQAEGNTDGLGQWQRRLRHGLVGNGQQRSKWLEALIIPVLAVLLVGWWRPHDPLLFQASFPWLWFAPLLVALRYGVLPGLLAAMVLLLDWLVCHFLGIYGAQDFPRSHFFGGLLLTLFAGEFADVWRDRLLRIDETNLYLVERLSGLTRRHLLLNLSHDRLEQEMLARPGSLRDALVRLRTAVFEQQAGQAVAHAGGAHAVPGVEALLHLLAQYVNIEAAALYACHGATTQGAGSPGALRLEAPVGSLGEHVALGAHDALLKLAQESGQLAHVAGDDLSLERQSSQLIVAPLMTSDERLIGVLAVSKLPFFSLNVENLQMLSVVLAYYADCVAAAPLTLSIRQELPALPVSFAEELARLAHMQQKFHITSQLLVLGFRGEHQQDIAAELQRIKRGLDLYWQPPAAADDHSQLVILLPFASHAARLGYLQRIDGWLQARFGAGLDGLHIEVRAHGFTQGEPLAALKRMLQA